MVAAAVLLMGEKRHSEVQPRFPRCICKGLHAAVVPEAAAVKGHLQQRMVKT